MEIKQFANHAIVSTSKLLIKGHLLFAQCHHAVDNTCGEDKATSEYGAQARTKDYGRYSQTVKTIYCRYTHNEMPKKSARK